MTKQRLSVVIPAYNEERSIGSLLDEIGRVKTEAVGFEKEIIVVDDGSSDRTAEVAAAYADRGVRLVRQANQGKGSAVQRGVREATGDYVLVQDADLEYSPSDYVSILEAAVAAGPDTAIYGSRTLGQRRHGRGDGRHPEQGLGPWLAGVLLTIWTWLLYHTFITDTLTGYKLYPTRHLRRFKVETRGFETDHEITAKLIRLGVGVIEVPIDYRPRSREEGKKIRMRDGFVAVWTLLRYRFGSLQ